MKKKLEADLISIAHRILKLRNKSELDQLYLETKALYEKLAVLKFVETHFADAKPTIGHQEVTESLQVIFDQEAETVAEHNDSGASADNTQEATTEAEAITAPQTTEEETEATDEEHETEAIEEETPAAIEEEETPAAIEAPEEETTEEAEAAEETETEDEPEEESSKEADFKPSFDLSFEKKEEEPRETPKQISFEDFLGNYTEPVFEKVSDKKAEPAAETPEPDTKEEETPVEEPAEEETTEEPTIEEPEEEKTPEQAKQTEEEQVAETEPEEEKEETPAVETQPEPAYEPIQPATENPLRSFTFGLNDRIGFEKHLFGGSSEDMNRVVSQLSTFDSFDEARNFIEEMVKPDYNNWEGKDDYAQRFLDIVERKFN